MIMLLCRCQSKFEDGTRIRFPDLAFLKETRNTDAVECYSGINAIRDESPKLPHQAPLELTRAKVKDSLHRIETR